MLLTLGLLTLASAEYGAAYSKKAQTKAVVAPAPKPPVVTPVPYHKKPVVSKPVGTVAPAQKYTDSKVDAHSTYGAAYRGKTPSTGSGSTGSGSTGSGSTGSGSTGSGSTGSGSTGSGSTGSGSTGAGSTGAGSTGAGSTGAGSTGAGSTGAGSTGAGSGTSASDPKPADNAAPAAEASPAGGSTGSTADSTAVAYPGLSLTWVLIVTGAVFAFVLIGVFAYSRLKNRIIDEETVEDSQSGPYDQERVFAPNATPAVDADMDDGSELSLPRN
jgi:hypothetical protein